MQRKSKKLGDCVFLKSKVGAIGIGTMIVFIAMVLVAGIAASVIIKTANTLEIKAVQAGDETKDEVGTGLRVAHIDGQVGNRNISGTWYNNTFHNLSIAVDVRAGSRDIDLSTTLVEISNGTVKCILTYNSGEPNFASSVSSNGLFDTNDDSSGTNLYEQGPNTFGIVVIKDADGSSSASHPVINRGDMAKLTLNVTAIFNGIDIRTDIWGQVIPEEGSPGVFFVRTPPVTTNDIYEIY